MRPSRWSVALFVPALLAAACSRSGSTHPSATTATAVPATTAAAAANPCTVPLQATDVGVTPTDITIEIMADVGSPVAPGVFQGAVDAINAFAARVNAHGGLACRQLKVRFWDSKLDPAESKNGQIDACSNAFALVGTSAGADIDSTTVKTCADRNGQATGLPDVAAFGGDDTFCGPTNFTVISLPQACPIPAGDNTYSEQVGYIKWQVQHDAGLHGLFLLAGFPPALTVGEVPIFTAFQHAGMVWDGTPKIGITDTQPEYAPRVQVARARGSNYVFNGAADTSLLSLRREAAAQGLTSIKVWACSSNCYTPQFIQQGGADAEGTYLWLDRLPFEEASYNADESAYVDGVGAAKADGFGAYAWEAADAFADAVNAVVAKDGPNGLTRATLVWALRNLTHFDGHGWFGPHALTGEPSNSSCFVVLQVQNGKFVRVYPTKPGTMDCDPSNLATVTVDAAAAAAKLN